MLTWFYLQDQSKHIKTQAEIAAQNKKGYMEMRGIDPRTSRMLSERSTI